MAINDVRVRGDEVFVNGRRVYPVQALSEPVHDFAWATDRAREGYKIRVGNYGDYFLIDNVWWHTGSGEAFVSITLAPDSIDSHKSKMMARTDWETCGKASDPPSEKRYTVGDWFRRDCLGSPEVVLCLAGNKYYLIGVGGNGETDVALSRNQISQLTLKQMEKAWGKLTPLDHHGLKGS